MGYTGVSRRYYQAAAYLVPSLRSSREALYRINERC
jgi:hypothetical protein